MMQELASARGVLGLGRRPDLLDARGGERRHHGRPERRGAGSVEPETVVAEGGPKRPGLARQHGLVIDEQRPVILGVCARSHAFTAPMSATGRPAVAGAAGSTGGIAPTQVRTWRSRASRSMAVRSATRPSSETARRG